MSTCGGQRGVLEAARQHRREGLPFALLLVSDCEGSTYRKPGALALVDAAGQRVGALSGGCLDSAIEQLGRDALAHGRVQAASFDTRGDEDRVFGSGSGCRGRMRVLAWPIPGAGDWLLQAIEPTLHEGRRVDLAVRVDPDGLGAGVADGALAAQGELDPALLRLPPGRHGLPEGGELARLQVAAIPRLLLLGAGPEAAPLLRLLRMLGWCCELGEHRPRWRAQCPAELADRLHPARPAAVLAQVAIEPQAVLVMSHLADTDLEALRCLAPRPVPWIGLLGPPARRDELLAELGEEARAALLPRLHAPVGLHLGGEGPEAIALAIAAQLQGLGGSK